MGRIEKYLIEATNNRGQINLTTASIEDRKELDVTMPECCASCMKAVPGFGGGGHWKCINVDVLHYFGSKIVYTAPDLLCKYYIG